MSTPQFKELMAKAQADLDILENLVKNAVTEHTALAKKLKKEPYCRDAEKMMDRLVFLGTWIKDHMQGTDCPQDTRDETCPRYRKSNLRRVRKALNFDWKPKN